MDHMGGLLKWLPWSGHLFLIGSLSICGLPLFNGFISEWLVFRSLLEGVFHLDMYGIIFSCIAIASLALIGGLAALCFSKAFGAVFLGNRRSSSQICGKEGGWSFRGPMVLLALICLWGGLSPIRMVSYAFEGVGSIARMAVPVGLQADIFNPLLLVTRVLLIGILIFLFLFLLRKISLHACTISWSQTWGCGYAKMTSRMQYSASSFARPILRIFRSIVYFTVNPEIPKGYFPKGGSLSSFVKDVSEYFVFRPAFYFIKKLSRKLKWIQGGRTQIYILYVLFLLVFLLIWKLH